QGGRAHIDAALNIYGSSFDLDDGDFSAEQLAVSQGIINWNDGSPATITRIKVSDSTWNTTGSKGDTQTMDINGNSIVNWNFGGTVTIHRQLREQSGTAVTIRPGATAESVVWGFCYGLRAAD